jgi:uncharacterized protein
VRRRATNEGRIEFETEDGLTLEGEVRMPDGTARGSAVICHPLPTAGGSKDHPLLWAIRSELAHRGFAVLAFNFRGVMGSEGEFGSGVAEVMDVRAAITAAQAQPFPLFVAGWSFGAHVALREAVDDERVGALALVGLPLAHIERAVGEDPLPELPGLEGVERFTRPVLLLSGEADQYSPSSLLRGLAERLDDAIVEIVPGADHYFSKREGEAARIVGEFAERVT